MLLSCRPTLAVFWLCVIAPAAAQEGAPAPLERLPRDVLDVQAPSSGVNGIPGRIVAAPASCRSMPREQLRRRIVDAAIQEWAYFGFTTVDESSAGFEGRRRRAPGETRPQWVQPEEAARVVTSIAGYWSATADGSWIIERQNAEWRRAGGVDANWRDPWSAAFISWLMCEGGIGDMAAFQRHIAHYVYIDQAIRARDNGDESAAFKAFEVGEMAVEAGDLLCRARRGAYQTLAQRRQDLGVGARGHCDVVVRLDPDNARILVIGGNVRGSVRLKFLPALAGSAGGYYRLIGRGDRKVFAHLKLMAPSFAGDALESSPTFMALGVDAAALRALRQRLVTAANPARGEPMSPGPTT